MCWRSSDRLSQRVCLFARWAWTTSLTVRANQESADNCLAKGMIAPSARVRLGAMILSGSIFCKWPKPLQVGQAPWGELKEKILGSISGRLKLQWWQAKCSEKRWSVSFWGWSGKFNEASLISTAKANPSDNLRAASKLSERRFLSLSTSLASLACFLVKLKRSTTASMVWRLVLIKAGGLSKSKNLPSILTLTKPFLARLLKSWLNSPFLSRTTGDRMINREGLVAVRLVRIKSLTRPAIWSSDCLAISRPQLAQWGWPIRA